MAHVDLGKLWQRPEGHVVNDSHRELVHRLLLLHVLENRDHLGWSGILRAETVASAKDYRLHLVTVEYVLDIEIQRISVGSRFLCTVKNGNAFDALRQDIEEVFG